MGFFDFMTEDIAIDLGTANTLIIHNGKVAYANIPFKVIAREEGEKQSRFIQVKYTDMKEFEK